MHEGHRRRMYEKLKSGDKLYEHELLEILLFNAYARKNTNPIAHALLDAFGTIEGVLNAEVEDLCAVEGVGESVALYLKCIGECTKKRSSSNGIAVLKSYDDLRKFAEIRLRGKTEEVLELYCLEKSGKIQKIITFTTNEQNRVEINTDRVSNVIATVKPAALFIAHNHLSESSNPSANDDKFTKEVQIICSMNGIRLYDHCIYANGGSVYSYFMSGKIDKIKRNYSFDKLVEGQIKKEDL